MHSICHQLCPFLFCLSHGIRVICLLTWHTDPGFLNGLQFLSQPDELLTDQCAQCEGQAKELDHMYGTMSVYSTCQIKANQT